MNDDTQTKPKVKSATIAPESAVAEPVTDREAQDWTNLGGDQIEAGIRKYPAEFQDDLRWYVRFSLVERNMSFSALAQELDVDTSTVSRALRGVYPGLKPPAKMMSRIRVMRQQEAERARKRGQGRIMTPSAKQIWTVCRKAWNDKLIAMIFGVSHIGKTEALKWFRDENNHGATIYVDLQGVGGVQDLYKEFARALAISPNCAFGKLKPRVLETISETTLVIVDEYHFITYAYLKASAKRMVSEIKSIHDRCHCGMVICATDVARADFEVGPEQKLNEQLWRRGTIKLQLPDALPVCDIRAIVNAYGLSMPDGPVGQTWMQFRTAHNELNYVGVLEDIARNQGIQSLITTLQDGNILASKAKRELRWGDVITVQSIYAQQLARKKA
ncbi:MAG: AAA family ATPase [Opitutaceae bacterium]|jgi:DNA transposition AAA+ family ATPase